ncbi:SGNH/GDSL hydrolase family protein [Nocardioides sp. URHA0020]|uniref:SGNH/GDSL hydrolase family protein n=1 Tax=Nocardioides sp. URHA0020 TaxID=1380392 RepID=UPI0009DF7FD8|nr:SGNH/GDSL hydrolase family protein [Nocardioides sp. URHA0020]
MRRRLVVLLLGALVLAGCSDSPDTDADARPPAVDTPSTSPTAAPPAYAEYVALGDSYTAAPLVPPASADNNCLRSGANYPALVAEAMPGTGLTDVSCSGAATVNMTHRQRGISGAVPPQFDALTRRTDLVTIGLGGNDDGLFGALIGQCTQLRASDPTGDPCTTALGPSVDKSLADIRRNVAEVVAGVRKRAPDARILVVGYPQIVPARGTCSDLPLADGDYAFAREVNHALTRAVEKAAADGKAEYVDLWAPSARHDICARDPWINGRVTTANRALAYHPLAVEQQAVAALVTAALATNP